MTRAEVVAAKRRLRALSAEIVSRETRGRDDAKTARLRQEYAALALRLKLEGMRWG